MLKNIYDAFAKELKLAETLDQVSALQIKYLGKNGVLSHQYGLLSKIVDVSDKSMLYKLVNDLKTHVVSSIAAQKQKIEGLSSNALIDENFDVIDVSLPHYPFNLGGVHFISATVEKVKRIFASFGFEIASGPQIENEYYVFDALNTPDSHPAREMQDTFYLKNKYVLRPHTSSVQIRVIEAKSPPIKVFSIGKVYRNDWDATHTPMFHQIEGLCIDKGINIANLKFIIKNFLENFFEKEIVYRLRPSFFPFTEPSLEVDILLSNGKWIEILGCGMVHRNVLSLLKVKSVDFTGFAFGIGVERLTMIQNSLFDIRRFYECDTQWLKHNSVSVV